MEKSKTTSIRRRGTLASYIIRNRRSSRIFERSYQS
nr:MAG TPA: hypothetical protein [Caudoviricetes sp.]